MRKNLVCKDCEERHIGCHADCERYIKETEEIREEKNKLWKNYDIDRAITGLEVERVMKAKGKRKK